MECLFEALFELFAELFLGAALELLADLMGRGITWLVATTIGLSPEALAASRVRAGQVFLWVLGGVGFGCLTLVWFPHPLVSGGLLHVLNLVVSPFLMAAALVGWGRLLSKYDRRRTALNHFTCAYAFALSYLLVRFFFTR